MHKHVEMKNCNGSFMPNGHSNSSKSKETGCTAHSVKNLPVEPSLNGAHLNPKENVLKPANKKQSDKIKTKQTANFEAETGKALKVFFKDMKEVQRQLSQCQDIGMSDVFGLNTCNCIIKLTVRNMLKSRFSFSPHLLL